MKLEREFITDPYLKLYLPLWKLDGASIRSEDAYGRLCTVTGARWGLKGRTFDGDDYIDVTTPGLNFTGDKTIILWLKRSDVATSSLNLIGNYVEGGVGAKRGYGFNTRTDTLGFDVADGTLNAVEALSSAMAVNTWAHIVGVHASTSVVVYTNAVAGTPVAITGYTAAATNAFRIGAYAYSATDFFLGTIGEAQIYNRAFSPIEIQSNYLATKWRYVG